MLVCATLFWAGNFTLGKFAYLENIPPNSLAFLRWCLVWIILFPFTYKEILKLKKTKVIGGIFEKKANFPTIKLPAQNNVAHTSIAYALVFCIN